MGIVLGLAGVGIALAALFGSRRRRRRRRRRAEDVPARRFGRPPLELSGAELYVVWAGKTWSRAEAYRGIHAIIDPLDREGLVEFFRSLAPDAAAVGEFLAVARWAGLEADANVRIQEALGILIEEGAFGGPEESDRARLRWVSQEDTYWEREADEGRPV